ncbi:MAG: HIT domain-containing protein [Ignavibacteria bacterium]|jgi:ATP adenylyltransferase|nr:HIT domain-containing protein [Ignavibacteria bacterium]MDH7527439.1 HIT domain-containing protein [Ignavibacteria bacterium]NPV12132.1 HIT domain-containing protein [Ignavibacteria bacterium]
MQRLFSPWRSEYIESFQNPKEEGCVFCNAQNEDVEDENSLLVYKGKEVFILMNRYPYNNGHLLIIPYRHIAKICEMTDSERLETFYLIEKSIEALENTMSAQGHNVGTNLGRVAGAGIDDHIHFHVVPRWNGDTNFMPVLGDVKLISEDMKKTKLRLYKFFKENL